MGIFVRNYRLLADAAGQEPDEVLLAPIEVGLAAVENEGSADESSRFPIST